MSTIEIKAYEIFKAKLGDKEAETLIEYVNSKKDNLLTDDKAKTIFLTEERAKTIFATKEDLMSAKNDIIRWTIAMIVGQTALLVTLIKLL
jgi:hypothetical protein